LKSLVLTRGPHSGIHGKSGSGLMNTGEDLIEELIYLKMHIPACRHLYRVQGSALKNVNG
jgi:hypothetical protein